MDIVAIKHSSTAQLFANTTIESSSTCLDQNHLTITTGSRLLGLYGSLVIERNTQSLSVGNKPDGIQNISTLKGYLMLTVEIFIIPNAIVTIFFTARIYQKTNRYTKINVANIKRFILFIRLPVRVPIHRGC